MAKLIGQTKTTPWQKVGKCFVDAGCIMLVDPCYVLNDGSPDYDEFCTNATTRHLDQNGFMEFTGGMVVSSGYGDGCYPVYVKKTSEGRIAEVRVVFA